MKNINVQKVKLKTKDIVYIALSTAIISVCSLISIPSAVPFTMQTFAIYTVLLLLGGKKGTTAILSYILLGLIGLPIFAGFRGGVGVLFGITGGYILGFFLLGVIYFMVEMFFNEKVWIKLASLILGTLVCYVFGTFWFMKIYANTSGKIGFITAFNWCVVPFIIPDLVKLVLANIITKKIKHLIL